VGSLWFDLSFAYSSFLNKKSRSSFSFEFLTRLTEESLNFSKLFCLLEFLSELPCRIDSFSFYTSASKHSLMGMLLSSNCLEMLLQPCS